MYKVGVALGTVRIIAETRQTVRIRMIDGEDDGTDDIWVPKYEVHYNSERWRNHEEGVFLVVNYGFAKRMGLVEGLDTFR